VTLNNQQRPLPETHTPRTYDVPVGSELETYHSVTTTDAVGRATLLGVVPCKLQFRIYNQRVMWLMHFEYDTRLTRDEIKRIMWSCCVHGFGAKDPEFRQSKEQPDNQAIATWFTFGAESAQKHITF